MIEFAAALLFAALTGWIIQTVSSGGIDRVVAGFRELLGGWRPDGWPRGVQEEDRDRPWGNWSPRSVPSSPSVRPVATTRVAAHTRSR